MAAPRLADVTIAPEAARTADDRRAFHAVADAVYAREPGIVVRRAVAAEDGVSSLFAIEFWKQFKT